VQEWRDFRSKIGLTNTKPKLMGDKLVDWCKNNDVALLTGITTERLMKFRTSLPFRTGDSSSSFGSLVSDQRLFTIGQ